MKTLIGLLILQGIVQKPENGMYFSKTENVASPYFSQLLLHFAGNSKFDADQYHKKLYKIQPVLIT